MGDPLATFGSLPSAFRPTSKSLKSHGFSLHIWKLSEGSWAALWGPQEVLFGVDVAQREELRGYYRFLQKTQKGQRPLTFRGGSSGERGVARSERRVAGGARGESQRSTRRPAEG